MQPSVHKLCQNNTKKRKKKKKKHRLRAKEKEQVSEVTRVLYYKPAKAMV
jgi:hypothetical protein